MNITEYKQKTANLLSKNKIKQFKDNKDYMSFFHENSTDIDDIMYYLYCIDGINNNVYIISQNVFLWFNDNKLKDYKHIALKFLRNKKINKLQRCINV